MQENPESPPKGLSAAGGGDAVRTEVERGPYGTGWADDEGDDDGGSSGQLESRWREPDGKGRAPATKTRQEQRVKVG